MIDPNNIETNLAHQGEIDIDLIGPSQIVPFGIWVERAVCNAFNEKLIITLQKEFCRRANSRIPSCCHVERSRLPSRSFIRRLETSLDV